MAASSLRSASAAEHRARQRAETAGVRDGDGQRAALHAGHGRLDDRKSNPEQLLERHDYGTRLYSADLDAIATGALVARELERISTTHSSVAPVAFPVYARRLRHPVKTV